MGRTFAEVLDTDKEMAVEAYADIEDRYRAHTFKAGWYQLMAWLCFLLVLCSLAEPLLGTGVLSLVELVTYGSLVLLAINAACYLMYVLFRREGAHNPLKSDVRKCVGWVATILTANIILTGSFLLYGRSGLVANVATVGAGLASVSVLSYCHMRNARMIGKKL